LVSAGLAWALFEFLSADDAGFNRENDNDSVGVKEVNGHRLREFGDLGVMVLQSLVR
jgi:hypothetical protein